MKLSLFSWIVVLFLLFPFSLALQGEPSGEVELRVQVCSEQNQETNQNTFGDVCAGTYPAACPTDQLSCDDGTSEGATNNKQGVTQSYGGARVEVYNDTITDCASITEVYVCYEFWCSGCTTLQHTCTVGVDANNGSSWSDSIASCSNGAPGVSCLNVTSNEVWSCSTFFGSSGSRALAKAQAQKTAGSGADSWNFDVLFFNVSYTTASVNNSPNITLNLPSNGSNFTVSSVVLNATATDLDNDTLTLFFHGNGILINTSTNLSNGSIVVYNWTGLTDGVQEWFANVSDGISNTSSQNRVFVVDTAAPISTSPGDATYSVNSTQTIDWVLTDNYAAGQYYVERNGVVVNASSWQNNSNLAIPMNTSVAGVWNYTLHFNDSLGNQGIPDTVLINITENASNMQPIITLENPANNSFTAMDSAVLQTTVYDEDLDALTVLFYGDDTLINTATNQTNGTTLTYNWTSLSEGLHNWTAIVTDGVVNSSSEYFFFTVDTIAPAVVIIVPEHNANYTSNESIALNYSSTDTNLDVTWYNLDHGDNTTLTQNITFNTSEGFHTVYVFANDSAHTVASAFASFTVSLPGNGSSSSSQGSGGSGSSSAGSNQGGRSGARTLQQSEEEAPRPQLPSRAQPRPSPGEEEGQPAPKVIQPSSDLTGAAIGKPSWKTVNSIGFFLLGLAILAGVLSYALRKNRWPAKRALPREEKPMQFTIAKEPSGVAKKARQILQSVKRSLHKIKEARQQKDGYLNRGKSTKKMMVKAPETLDKLEGFISQEFLAKLNGKEKPKEVITPDDLSIHFPETMKELQQKGIPAKEIKLKHHRINTGQVKQEIERKQGTVSSLDLRKLFPETLGKVETKLPEQDIRLHQVRSSLALPPSKQREPVTEDYIFRPVEEPEQKSMYSGLRTNRKINKKTNKQTLLQGLEEVYDIE